MAIIDCIAICSTIETRGLRHATYRAICETQAKVYYQPADGSSRFGEQASLIQAAELRGVSISDYVRMVTISQARREVTAAKERTIVLGPDEQLAFWNALNAPVVLTSEQKRLGRMMRGEE